MAAFASALLASCATSDSDVPFGFATADIAPIQSQQTPAEPPLAADAGQTAPTETVASFVVEEGDPLLPDSVVAAPALRPGSEAAAATEVAVAATGQPATAMPTPSDRLEEQGSTDGTEAAAPAAGDAAPVAIAALAPTAPAQKKRSFLSSFFSPAAPAAPQQKTARPLIDPTASRPAAASTATPAQPIVQLASTGQPAAPLVTTGPSSGNASPLPGVREGGALYEISRRSGMDDDSDIDLHEGEEPGVQFASAAGLARLAPNGLMKQTDRVDVACLKPSLVRVLKAVEKNYGKKVVVTSGYRSPDKNRRARGARNSLHMYCAAADVQVEGVSKWELASFVRSMPGRGGVGTYCHTDSVHIDVGPERDWNWRCRRRK
ncbi:MAG: YcbK family protein [Aquamicrobium sp.]|uniref:YcbK family protein n=1 Tax=Aquamicrobium sp. TaxID=1872579 RepID=UPI00349E9DAC|nr:YcbK family protein [Aquamicrobium sp.]